MALTVTFTEDPARVLNDAGEFLAADPVRNFTMLNLLRERVAQPQQGRYWVVKRDGAVDGVVFWSPIDFPNILVTRMEPDAIDAVVESIDGMSEELDLEFSPLRGVSGPVSTADAFAGRWTEVSGYGAVPVGAQRLYEATEFQVGEQFDAQGRLRQADWNDRDLLIKWMTDFHRDHEGIDPTRIVDARLPAGRLWIWEDGQPVSFACQSEPQDGVVSIQVVYTPPKLRLKGYASGCVTALTARILWSGHRSILYTNLANHTANSIYRKIGYRVLEEMIQYRFETAGIRS